MRKGKRWVRKRKGKRKVRKRKEGKRSGTKSKRMGGCLKGSDDRKMRRKRIRAW